MSRPLPFATAFASALAAVLITALLATAAPPPAEHIRELEDLAKEHIEAEDFFQADRTYRRLIFATGNKGYDKELKSTGDRIAEQVLEMASAVELPAEDRIQLLNRGLEFDRGNAKLEKELKKAGCEFFNGAWRPKEEIRSLKTNDQAHSELRRQELDLAGARIIREGPYRFFTDVPAGNQQVENMVKASVGVYNAYLIRMRAFDLRFPEEGLDVVILTHEKDYLAKTGSDGTVGVYKPSKGASYFFVSGAQVFQTLLHELVHQFNHKVGYFGDITGCLSEGMAEYFGYSKLSGGMSRVEPGTPNSEAVRSIQDIVHGRTTKFVYTKFDEFLIIEDPPNYDFYEQSWAFYTFLVHSPDPRLRLALHDYLVGTREDDGPSFPKVIARYGFTPATIEQAFLDHWRTPRG